MHRSGTSAMTRGLKVLGVELSDRLIPARQDNAKGYFEDIDINAFNIKILQSLDCDWHHLAPIEKSDIERLHNNGLFLEAVELLRRKTVNIPIFGFKDPRLCKLLPFWHPVFMHCGFDISYVIIIRNPLSVFRSLVKRFELSKGEGEPYISSGKSNLLWLLHVLYSLLYTKDFKRIIVDYDNLLESPDKCINKIAEHLQLNIDQQALQEYQSEFLDKMLRNTTYTLNDLTIDQSCPPLIQEVYNALHSACLENPQLDDAVLHAKTCFWISEFDRLKSILRVEDTLYEKIEHYQHAIRMRDSEINNLKQSVSENRHDFLLQIAQLQQQLEARRFESIEREQALNAELAQARQQLETRLIHLAEREQTFTQQLQEMHQKHEQQQREQEREHTHRGQALNAELAQARQQLETHLINQAERERIFAQQLQEMHQKHEQQQREQEREHTHRGQALNAELAQARQQLETHLINQAERERIFAQQLREVEKINQQKRDGLKCEHAEREQELTAQLLAVENELNDLNYRIAVG